MMGMEGTGTALEADINVLGASTVADRRCLFFAERQAVHYLELHFCCLGEGGYEAVINVSMAV